MREKDEKSGNNERFPLIYLDYSWFFQNCFLCLVFSFFLGQEEKKDIAFSYELLSSDHCALVNEALREWDPGAAAQGSAA